MLHQVGVLFPSLGLDGLFWVELMMIEVQILLKRTEIIKLSGSKSHFSLSLVTPISSVVSWKHCHGGAQNTIPKVSPLAI